MQRTRFDRLHMVRLVHESYTGRTELCREPDGTQWVRLCIQSPGCQRELLNTLDQTVPVRLEQGALELLLPWHEGVPLRQWLYERKPTLGQRRDASLSLLGQQVELRGKLPPCLTALAAYAENLTVGHDAIALQYLPRLRDWTPGIGEAQAVRAVAGIICEILAPADGQWPGGRLPEELQLLYCRQQGQDYADWGQLQRDVAAISDELPRITAVWRSYVGRVWRWLARYGNYILRILAVILLTAALLSLVSEYRRRKGADEPAWPGMPLVGDQDLREGEGGG